MPSPDLRRYIDLTLYDEDSQRIYLNALEYARVALPDFRPREGSLELVLMQALAVEVASLSRAINRLPGGVLQVLLQLYGLYRNEATLPTTVIRFNAVDNQTYSIPAGARLYYQTGADFDPLVLVTDAPVSLTHAKNVLSIQVVSGTATVTTSTRHGFEDGQEIVVAGVAAPNADLNVTTTISYIDSSSFSYSTSSGDVSLNFVNSVSATPPTGHPSSGFVSASGTVGTGLYNGLSANTAVDLLSGLSFVASSYIDDPVTGGEEAESDDDYLARATAQLGRMSRTLSTKDGYIQWAVEGTEFPYVYRAYATEGTGTVRLIVAPISASATNLLTGIGNSSLLSDPSSSSWGQKDEIRVAAQEISHAAVTVTVADPHLVEVSVSATVKPTVGTAGTTMQNGITNALADYLSPDSWDWDTIIRKNELIGIISGVTSEDGSRLVDYVSDLSIAVTAVIPDQYGQTELSDSTPVWSAGTLTVASTAHGIESAQTNYVALKIDDEWQIFEADISTVNEFTVDIVSDPGISAAVQWIDVASIAANGDLTMANEAPLTISGNHTVAVL